jgi:hypothetical protein
MKRNKLLFPLIAVTALLIAVLVAVPTVGYVQKEAVRKQTEQKAQEAYRAVDAYLTAFYQNDAKGVLACMPEKVVDASLQRSEQDKTAWQSEVRDHLKGLHAIYTDLKITMTWSLQEVIEPDKFRAESFMEYFQRYGFVPENLQLVKILQTEDQDGRKTEFSATYMAYQLDGVWYVGSTNWKLWIESDFQPNAFSEGGGLAGTFLYMVRRYHLTADGPLTDWMPPTALAKLLADYDATPEQYNAAILRRMKVLDEKNRAAGIWYHVDVDGEGFTQKLKGKELQNMRDRYQQKFGLEVEDAASSEVYYYRGTMTEKMPSHFRLNMTTVKIDGKWYIDVTNLPWPQTDIFSFEHIDG